MDLTAITGNALQTSSYIPFSASPSRGEQSAVGPAGAFASLLEKTRTETGDEKASESGVLSKPVINKKDKLYEQCEALETFLIKSLIKGMRNTVEKSKLIDTGFAGEMYEDMLYDKYAEDFSRNTDFGLAEMAYMELSGQRGKVMTNRALF